MTMKLRRLFSTVNPLIVGFSLLMPSFGRGAPETSSRKPDNQAARPFDDPCTGNSAAGDSDAAVENRSPMFAWDLAHAVVSGTGCTNLGSSPNVVLISGTNENSPIFPGAYELDFLFGLGALTTSILRDDPQSPQINEEYVCHVQIPVEITKTKWSTRWIQDVGWGYVNYSLEPDAPRMSGELSLSATLCGLPTIPINKTTISEGPEQCPQKFDGSINVVPETLFSQGDTVECLYEADITISAHSNDYLGAMTLSTYSLTLVDENSVGCVRFEECMGTCVDDSGHTTYCDDSCN